MQSNIINTTTTTKTTKSKSNYNFQKETRMKIVNSQIIIVNLIFLSFFFITQVESFTCTLNGLGGEQPEEICVIRDFLQELMKKKSKKDSEKKDLLPKGLVSKRNAFILYGERGLGKTSIGKAFAKNVNGNSTFKAASDIFSKKNSCKTVKQIYKKADEASRLKNGTRQPYIIIIDDIDDYATVATENQTPNERSGMQTLRGEIDEYENNPYVITLLITNNYKAIDDRLQSRCTTVQFFLPDFDSRLAIIELYARMSQNSFLSDETFLQRLAHEMKFFSGRDIEAVFSWAVKMKKGRCIDKSTLLIALEKQLNKNPESLIKKHGIDYYCTCNNNATTRKKVLSKYLSENEHEIKSEYGWWCYKCCWSCNQKKSVRKPFAKN